MGLRANPDPVDAPDWTRRCAGIARVLRRDGSSGWRGREYLAGRFSYADIAFYMAQFFAARHTVPMTPEQPRLLEPGASAVFQRGPVVARVVTAMADYLRGQGRMVPELG